ncbi:MAG: hypothetical protein SCK70_11720, partial [bacterium]|nr:hypothetical protein [bacterium]
TTESMYANKKKTLLKRIKQLDETGKKNLDHQSYADFKNKKLQAADLYSEIIDEMLNYSPNDKGIVRTGIKVLVEIVEESFYVVEARLDYFLIDLLEKLQEFGLKIKEDQLKLELLERMRITADLIMFENVDDQRKNLIVTKIAAIMEAISTQKLTHGTKQLVKKTIDSVEFVVKNGMRRRPVVVIEYSQLVDVTKRLAVFAIENSHDNLARESVENIGYFADLSFSHLQEEKDRPLFSICDALADIGISAATNENEVICGQCINRHVEIIKRMKAENATSEMEKPMASWLILMANTWQSLEFMQDKLFDILAQMKHEIKIDYANYIESTKKILKTKSHRYKAIFKDFLDEIKDYQRFESGTN